MDHTNDNPAVLHLVIAGFALFLFALIPVFCQVFRFNKVRCATCGDKLRERDAFDHGGDSGAHTHYGICADKHANIHRDMDYGG